MTTDQGSPAAYRIVGVTEATRADFEAADDATWFGEPRPSGYRPTLGLDLARSHAATLDGRTPFAGTYSSFAMTVTIPGGVVPMAGLTWVSVHPDHRRRGILSAMLDHHLRERHEAGEVLGGLHASEVGIYGRFGYAVASVDLTLEIASGARIDAPGVSAGDVTTRLLPVEGSAEWIWQLQADSAARHLGQVVVPRPYAVIGARETPASLRGSEPRQALIAERAGVVVGHALLRRSQRWEHAESDGTLTCRVEADDAGAELALLHRLTSFDLVRTVTIGGLAADDAAVWWLGGPRSAHPRAVDALWLRVIDVGAALAQRTWAAGVDTVIEVVDDGCPWNARRWHLDAGPDGATCEPTRAEADVRMPVQTLAAAYLGGRTISALTRQGLIEEDRAGAVAALSVAMATDQQPVGATMF